MAMKTRKHDQHPQTMVCSLSNADYAYLPKADPLDAKNVNAILDIGCNATCHDVKCRAKAEEAWVYSYRETLGLYVHGQQGFVTDFVCMYTGAGGVSSSTCKWKTPGAMKLQNGDKRLPTLWQSHKQPREHPILMSFCMKFSHRDGIWHLEDYDHYGPVFRSIGSGSFCVTLNDFPVGFHIIEQDQLRTLRGIPDITVGKSTKL